MRRICGVDGCKGGWVAIIKDLDSGIIWWQLCKTAKELFYNEPTSQVTAIDIPIGLPERGPRDCDPEARRLLGPGRGSSVFPAPIQAVLNATTYEDACRIGFEVEGKKLSRQAWAIIPKIREIDQILNQDPELHRRVREIHPEVCFYFLNSTDDSNKEKKSSD